MVEVVEVLQVLQVLQVRSALLLVILQARFPALIQAPLQEVIRLTICVNILESKVEKRACIRKNNSGGFSTKNIQLCNFCMFHL